jgi:pSer/pThr/pTyr-binding forkhead associated (FHA) protein
MPELVLKLGDNEIGRFVFEKDIMSIGRAKDNDVVIENLSVSRNHARIRFHNGKYVLTDLNSANGTFVNGERHTKIELGDGDKIQVGKHLLLFINKQLSEEQLLAEQLGGDRTIVVNTSSKPLLVVDSGKSKGKDLLITKFETRIGKAADCDLVLTDDWLMPAILALILRRGDDVYEIHNRGKMVSTKVNGENVDAPRILKYGDQLEFGSVICRFERAPESRLGSGVRPKVDLAKYDSVFGKSEDSAAAIPPSSSADSPIQPVVDKSSVNKVSTELPEEEPIPGLRERTPLPAPGMETASFGDSGGQGYGEEDPKTGFESDHQALMEAREESLDLADIVAVGEHGGDEPKVVPQSEPRDPAGTGVSPMQAAMMAASGGNQASSFGDIPAVPTPGPAPSPSSQNLVAPAPWRLQEFPPLPEGVDPKEVAMWEAMLDNKSAVVRKQAARQLKKLTDRDYDI